MTKTRSAFSWGLSIFVHTLLLILIIRFGYRYAFPEGDVSAGVSFEVAGGNGGQSTAPEAKPVEKRADITPVVEETKKDVPLVAKEKKADPVPATLPEKAVTKVEEKTLPQKAVEEVKEVPPPPAAETETEQSTEVAQEPPKPTEEEVDESPSRPPEEAGEEERGETADNEQGEKAEAGETLTAGDGSAVPKFGTPGTTLDESKLEEMQTNRKPRYPWMARLRRHQGTVELRAYIRKDGQVDLPILQKSSGYPILDREALDSFSKWRYKPGKAGWIIKAFIFTIKD